MITEFGKILQSCGLFGPQGVNMGFAKDVWPQKDDGCRGHRRERRRGG